MKIVTLISDWKLRDPYIAMFKGELISAIPDIHIFDITHSIDLYNIQQTAFILKNSYLSFPKDTLHIVLTGLSFSDVTPLVLVSHNGHFFLSEDNGLFSLMFSEESGWTAYRMDEKDEKTSITEKMNRIANWHFNGELSEHSIECDNLKTLISSRINLTGNKLTGKIIYIDSACNAISNIPVSFFHEICNNRKFKVIAGERRNLITSVYHDYYQDSDGGVYLVPNRLGFIEISIYHGNIAALADLHVGDAIDIIFE